MDNIDYSAYSDAALQDLLDSAESDSEIREAVQQELQKRRPIYDEEREKLVELPPEAFNEVDTKPLPYPPIGSLLWPLITALVIAGILGVVFKLLHSWGDFDPQLYYLLVVASVALLSPAFVISGIRDLANQKAEPTHRVCTIKYYVFAVLWFAAFVYSLYNTTRLGIMIAKMGIGAMVYYSIPKLLTLFICFFMQSIFFILARELGRKPNLEQAI